MIREEDLKGRTRRYALGMIRLYAGLPKAVEAQVIGKQFIRSGTSVGAQYRETCRAKSDADFISKIEGCLQELEETAYWLELTNDARLISSDLVKAQLDETHELIAIFVTIAKKVKSRKA